MKRRLFNLATTLSLVVCIVTVVIWARSFAGENILLEFDRGQCLLIGIDEVQPKAVRDARASMTLEQFVTELRSPPPTINGVVVARPSEHRVLGFTWVRGGMGKVFVAGSDGNNFWTPPFWILGVPLWFIVVITLALPVQWLGRRWMRSRRERLNRCADCGYDLRATPLGRCCPECGTVKDR
jgi:hypothetical protein